MAHRKLDLVEDKQKAGRALTTTDGCLCGKAVVLSARQSAQRLKQNLVQSTLPLYLSALPTASLPFPRSQRLFPSAFSLFSLPLQPSQTLLLSPAFLSLRFVLLQSQPERLIRLVGPRQNGRKPLKLSVRRKEDYKSCSVCRCHDYKSLFVLRS